MLPGRLWDRSCRFRVPNISCHVCCAVGPNKLCRALEKPGTQDNSGTVYLIRQALHSSRVSRPGAIMLHDRWVSREIWCGGRAAHSPPFGRRCWPPRPLKTPRPCRHQYPSDPVNPVQSRFLELNGNGPDRINKINGIFTNGSPRKGKAYREP